jgi:D-alanine-D-alanine ligase
MTTRPAAGASMTRRPIVAVLFGGRSLEHDVSVVSGLQVLHAIDPDAYAPMPVYIDHDLRWWVGEDLWYTQSFKKGGPQRARLTEVALSPGFGTSTLLPVSDRPFGNWVSWRGQHVDVFVPVLHGTFGEDGSLQGLLELGGCAFVGCGVFASAVGMNKRATKIIAQQAGVPVVPWLSIDRATVERDGSWLRQLPAKVARNLGWPAMVKPCNLGSSAGVSVAGTPDELAAAVLRVCEYDVEALIEPFIKNRLELNVAVAGLDRPVASVTEMPITQQGSPLTFSEKYKREGTKSVGSSAGIAGALRVLDPEQLPAEMRSTAQGHAITVFTALGCEGISRIDFLIDADNNTLYFNEINTLPGSLAFYLWSAAPYFWTITELLDHLMRRAERLAAMKRGLERRPPTDLQLLK